MSDHLLVSTRKGLLEFHAGKDGWRRTATHFPGVNATLAMQDRRDGTLYAALNHGHFGVKLHRSDDAGKTWAEVAAPAYPKAGEDEAPSLVLIWCLEEAGPDGGLWAGTIPGGLFRSDDRGDSWSLVESLWNRPEREKWFGGGYDKPGIHSVCVDPRDARRVAIAVSCGGVWETTDGGKTWDIRTKGMFAAYMPPEMREDGAVQDPHRMVQCAAAPDTFWLQHHNGVFLSEDNLRSWRDLPDVPPSVFGFAVAVHPKEPGTAWFVPAIKDEIRMPVDGKLVVARTRDGGKTFDTLGNGLPGPDAFDLIYRHGLDVAADGRTLAMGSTTGGLWVSRDSGDSWAQVSAHLPPISAVRFA